MVTKVVASLSDVGWADSPDTILSKLLGYYILTDAAQSITFQGNLINLPETYYLFLNDPTGMAVRVKEDLDKLLSRYFESVDVSTEAVMDTESRYGIVLYASVITDKGVKVSLGKVVEMESSGVKRVIDINNYGDGLSALSSL